MNNGLFITFEGVDACGKTTQVNLFKEYAKKHFKKNEIIFLHEPGGTVLGENIRSLLLSVSKDAPVPKAELMLFLASRAQICEKVILPALNEGKIVVADRFYDSTIAYQGMARGVLAPKDILALNKLVIGNLTPNLTFYLKISAKEAMARKKKMGEGLDRFEKEKADFHQKVCEGYDFIAKKEKKRFHVIDATRTVEDIQNEIISTVNEKLKKKGN